jgi:hypothetical protein
MESLVPPTSLTGSARLRTAVALGTAALAVTALAACSSSGSGHGQAAAASSKAPVVPASIAPTSPQHPIPADNQIVEVPALRKTILMTGCKAADGGWSGTGTAKNADKAEETYKILVFFTDKYSRTIDSATTTVKVAAGQTANWTAKTSFKAPQGTQCVLRGLSKA